MSLYILMHNSEIGERFIAHTLAHSGEIICDMVWHCSVVQGVVYSYTQCSST